MTLRSQTEGVMPPKVDDEPTGMLPEPDLARAWALSAKNEGHQKRLPEGLSQAERTFGTTTEAVLKCLQVRGGTSRQIADRAGVSIEVVRSAINRLRQTGYQIETVGKRVPVYSMREGEA